MNFYLRRTLVRWVILFNSKHLKLSVFVPSWLNIKTTKMKKTLLIILLIMIKVAAIACPACEKQPKILAGITHGSGPDSNWDYVIVWATVLIVLATLFYTIKWLIMPGESSYNHIKRTVLN